MKTIDWYFDFVSPFAYLQLEHFHLLPEDVTVRYKPVLLGALLERSGSKGPAETPARRLFTYRHLVWLARHHGVPYRMPPAHPFNPLKTLRLAIALGSRHEVVQKIFRFFWREGHNSDDPADWAWLTAHLGVDNADARVNDPVVKEQLHGNTQEAIDLEVFGVPTFVVDGELFWGFDATGMLLDYLKDPNLFQDQEMIRVSHLPVGVQRKVQ